MSERRVVVTRFVAETEEHNGTGRPVAAGELFWTAGGEDEADSGNLVVSTVRARDPFFCLPLDAVTDHRDHVSPPEHG